MSVSDADIAPLQNQSLAAFFTTLSETPQSQHGSNIIHMWTVALGNIVRHLSAKHEIWAMT